MESIIFKTCPKDERKKATDVLALNNILAWIFMKSSKKITFLNLPFHFLNYFFFTRTVTLVCTVKWLKATLREPVTNQAWRWTATDSGKKHDVVMPTLRVGLPVRPQIQEKECLFLLGNQTILQNPLVKRMRNLCWEVGETSLKYHEKIKKIIQIMCINFLVKLLEASFLFCHIAVTIAFFLNLLHICIYGKIWNLVWCWHWVCWLQ